MTDLHLQLKATRRQIFCTSLEKNISVLISGSLYICYRKVELKHSWKI